VPEPEPVTEQPEEEAEEGRVQETSALLLVSHSTTLKTFPMAMVFPSSRRVNLPI
jgi:hypothetical protein